MNPLTPHGSYSEEQAQALSNHMLPQSGRMENMFPAEIGSKRGRNARKPAHPQCCIAFPYPGSDDNTFPLPRKRGPDSQAA